MRPLLLPLLLAVSLVSRLSAQSYGADEIPAGTNWIADQKLRLYYPVHCALASRVPKPDRLYFATESAVRLRGFARSADCAGAVALPRLEDPPAKPRHLRRGFWFSGGLGYGSLGCENCGGREGGLSGGIQLGGSLSQKVLLGGGTNGWTRDEGGATLTVGTVAAVIRFYPSSTGGFFLLGGLGLGTIYVDVDGFGSDTETGAGALVGLGYDFRVGENVSLTPFWNGFAVKTANADANVGQIGLSVTLH